MSLAEYRNKRRFDRSPEPRGVRHKHTAQLQFVIQKHAASRLHYDFRLEFDGVLKSWAVPKGPSLDPSVKSLAVQVEDHPLEYATFEGVIPQGQYGGGTVMLWDRGTWEPVGDPRKMFHQGKVTFDLHGEKLRGRWALIRMRREGDRGRDNWLLKKVTDKHARPAAEYDVLASKSKSVASRRTMENIAAAADHVWNSNREATDEVKVSRKNEKPRTRKTKRSHKSHRKLEVKDLGVGEIAGARRRARPKKFTPQMATLVKDVPEGDHWLHEIKLDGYRLLCVIDGDESQLLTRNGNNWTDRFPTVTAAARELGIDSAILDGEVVVLAADGTSDFQSLQNLMRRGQDDDIVFFVFDLPYFAGYDLTRATLVDRKRLLKQVLGSSDHSGVIRFSDHIVGDGSKVLEASCRRALDGIVSKRIDSHYEQRRSLNWVKVKCLKRQEFVIGGWSDPGGARAQFGALLLGYHDEHGRLVFCGRVGTGFNTETLTQVKGELEELAVTEPPFDNPPSGYAARGAHWVRPKLVAEIEFAQWTREGMLRQPVFLGLREDKSPREVTREEPAELTAPSNGHKKRRRVKRSK